MKKAMIIALAALTCGIAAAPNASAFGLFGHRACGERVISERVVVTGPMVETSCNQTLVQPAIVERRCRTLPAVIETTGPVVRADACDPCLRRHRHHLFSLGTPLFGLRLF